MQIFICQFRPIESDILIVDPSHLWSPLGDSVGCLSLTAIGLEIGKVAFDCLVEQFVQLPECESSAPAASHSIRGSQTATWKQLGPPTPISFRYLDMVTSVAALESHLQLI